MNDDVIRNLLEQLHRTVDGTTSITEKDRELLKRLSADIQAVLERPADATPERHQTTMGQLRAAVTRFEVSHPDLTATLAQVSKALADMGI